MTFVSQAKKPFVWICIIIAAMCCVVVLHRNSADIYQFAVNTRHQVLDRLNLTRWQGTPCGLENLTRWQGTPCGLETACRLKELRERIRRVCFIDKRVQYAHQTKFGAHLNHKHQLLYFAIPKVGCSFWKRIFKVLNAKNNHTSMFDIPNYKAHSGPGLVRANSRADVDRYLQDYTSFLFVRDPFSRLFSGYVDKMFVPNPIALTHGRVLFSKYRTRTRSKRCELNIPFGDFARYTAESILSHRMRDPHFFPMSQHLNPCDVNLTYVAKMEHFMDDTNYILSSVGVSLDDVSGQKEDDFEEMHEKGYMEDIIKRTFKYMRKRKPCISPRMVLQRLWTTFQIRGYLLKSQKMPNFKNPAEVKIKEFVDATFLAYDLAPNSKKERSHQRSEAMMEAYSMVSRPTLRKLALAFGLDCRLFEYSCNVNELFPETKNVRPFYFRN